MSWPAYLKLHESGELKRRAEEAIAALGSCRLCPRNCGVDRLADRKMTCKEPQRFPELTRPLSQGELQQALEYAREAGLRRLDARRSPRGLG